MFDIGFWELVLVFVIALVVLGPERLPGAARQVGLWVRRIRGMAQVAQQELERELKISELRQQLHDNPDLKTLQSVREDLQRLRRLPAQSIQPPSSSSTPSEPAPNPLPQDPQP
ncbi:MAG TPA: Sec-independent protein translocase protein TatB [Candidatus Macondimonas sp.]|nr:Sec-independent protein translocase protein TatB [Candidatus Macondimonas sp.]